MVFGDIHAAAIAPSGSHHRHVERTLTRGSNGDPGNTENRWRLAADGSIALAMSLAAMGGCYARHWWRGDVLRKDVSWLHFKKEVR
jgi:hypothetical protein